jgi:hypothetical protein
MLTPAQLRRSDMDPNAVAGRLRDFVAGRRAGANRIRDGARNHINQLLTQLPSFGDRSRLHADRNGSQIQPACLLRRSTRRRPPVRSANRARRVLDRHVPASPSWEPRCSWTGGAVRPGAGAVASRSRLSHALAMTAAGPSAQRQRQYPACWPCRIASLRASILDPNLEWSAPIGDVSARTFAPRRRHIAEQYRN